MASGMPPRMSQRAEPPRRSQPENTKHPAISAKSASTYKPIEEKILIMGNCAPVPRQQFVEPVHLVIINAVERRPGNSNVTSRCTPFLKLAMDWPLNVGKEYSEFSYHQKGGSA